MKKIFNFKALKWMLLFIVILPMGVYSVQVKAGDQLIVFPLPQEIMITGQYFELNDNVNIVIPQNASDTDLFLARFLVRELSDKYGIAIKTKVTSKLPDQKPFILIGSIHNSLVNEYCKKENLNISADQPGPEGYMLRVTDRVALVAGSDSQGAFYGLQSLRQLIQKDADVKIQGANIRDLPVTSFRGIRLYIPGPENITFFKRFLRDFMALYKFNKVILEVNACMRFDRHPELNAGWIEFAKNMHYTRRSRPAGPHNQYQNSAHHDAGDGGILEKQDVKDLVNFANEHYIEVIPEIPSLTHSYYLLSRHRELAEIQNAEWPDTYCPSNPQSYDLLFDVMEEYIEVINPKMIHIGHDEWRMPVDVCPKCTGKDYNKLFISDITKIYNFLKDKNIKVGIWGDHLLESVRNKGFRDRESSSGYKYKIPGALTPQQVKDSIPKDILVFNWFWGDPNNDLTVQNFGFKQVYGNFRPNISNWEQKQKLPSVLGGAPSSWAATTEFNFGKDLLYDFLGCANLLWSRHHLNQRTLPKTVQNLIPTIRSYLREAKNPSEDCVSVVSLNIAKYFNAHLKQGVFNIDLSDLLTGEVGWGSKFFQLIKAEENGEKSAIVVQTKGQQEHTSLRDVNGIQVNEDVSSLIFLHACAKPAENEKSFRTIYNFDDTADLLGWYEIVYEDAFIETIPIRYGVNILEYNVSRSDKIDHWPEGKTGAQQDLYCYAADAVNCSQYMEKNPITFFAFEWKNSRFGKKIREINLKGTTNYKNYKGNTIEDNAIIWIALSIVKSII